MRLMVGGRCSRVGRLTVLAIAGLLSACAAAPAADYLVSVGADPVSTQPSSRMIPGTSQDQQVFRYLVQGLDGPETVRVTVATANNTPTGRAMSVRVVPRFGSAAVQFDPLTGILEQLPGTWSLFQYLPDAQQDIQTVHLAGSFNGWSTNALPMPDRGDGVYQALVKLPDGVHWYKFVVNGDTWINDPASDTEFERSDGNFGMNSAVLVGVDARGLPAPLPDHIKPSVVIHDPSDVPDMAVASNTLLRLSIRTQTRDVKRAAVLLRPDGDEQWSRHPLDHCGEAVGLDRYGALIETDGRAVHYLFELTDGSVKRYRSAKGLLDTLDLAAGSAYTCDMRPAYVTPDWAKAAVWYQLFPERFRNGNTSNDPDNTQRWQANWWATLPGEAPGKENFYAGAGNVWARRFGGDFQGAKEMLPYLRELGVNAIYLNPVFESVSLHKYDASDYRHIDDNFGVRGDLEKLQGETQDPGTWQWSDSDKVFLDFIQEAHRQGFKVILDGVFNHVGEHHYAFEDVLRNGKDSVYADWFDIFDWGTGGAPGKPGGIQWRAWDHDNGQLPIFKKDPVTGLAPGPRKHIFDITRRWMAPDGDPSKGVDGWRLDVASDIPHPFWIEWRSFVKSINPDAYITGEIWTWAQPWLASDQFDGVMNYQFAIPMQDFFVDRETAISPSAFSDLLNQLVYAYPLQSALVQQNLIDSHDTDRLASMFANPDRGYDTANQPQGTGPDYSIARPNALQWRRMSQAIVCQMTFMGAPMIYYGTEAGMWSPDDPANRQPMIWRDLLPYDDPQIVFNQELFSGYQRLIALRRGLAALQRGFFRTLIADDKTGVLAFARDLDGQHVYIVINKSPVERSVRIPLADTDQDAMMIDWLDPAQARLSADLSDAADARPVLEPIAGAGQQPEPGPTITVRLAPYGSAVLASREQVR